MKCLKVLIFLNFLLTGCGSNVMAPGAPGLPETNKSSSEPASKDGSATDASPSSSKLLDAFATKNLSFEESDFLNRINALRAENGQGKLTINASLQNAASIHSEFMRKAEKLTHLEPDEIIKNSWDRIHWVGGSFHSTGENIASGAADGATVFEQWFHSAGHRYNMLSEKYQYIGISVKGVYWTTDFGGD